MVKKEIFGKTKSGQEIYRYWLENEKGMRAGVINYGAILVNLFVPDKEGKVRTWFWATIRWSPTLKTADFSALQWALTPTA